MRRRMRFDLGPIEFDVECVYMDMRILRNVSLPFVLECRLLLERTIFGDSYYLTFYNGTNYICIYIYKEKDPGKSAEIATIGSQVGPQRQSYITPNRRCPRH